MVVFSMEGEAGNFETLSSITASTGCTNSLLKNSTGQPCKCLYITVETADIRMTFDGTTPTTTATTAVGHLVTYGSNFIIKGWENIRNFRCINAVAASGSVVKVTFLY